MVIKLTTTPAKRAGTDTFKVSGTLSYIIFAKFFATRESTSRILGIPIKIPSGMPTAPMHIPSNMTELRSCLCVAPTDMRIPNWCVRSFNEMLNEL